MFVKKVILYFQTKNQKKKLMLQQTTRALLSLSLQDLKKKEQRKLVQQYFIYLAVPQKPPYLNTLKKILVIKILVFIQPELP